MIDTLYKHKKRFNKPKFWTKFNLIKNNYLVMTLHRPGNVDDKEKLKYLINEIIAHSNNFPIIFPVHPRTKKILLKLGIIHTNLHMINPMGYLHFNYLVKNAKAVITDSGGITEETTVLGIPCITLRDNTERPETVEIGTNELVGTNPSVIKPILKKLFFSDWKKGSIPELWDGKTSERIVSILLKIYKVDKKN